MASSDANNVKQQIEVDGRALTISNADKVYFPDNGFAKGEVIAFYSDTQRRSYLISATGR